LRFALSEHFLNVDELLSQLQAGPSTPPKKKLKVDQTRNSKLETRETKHERQVTGNEKQDKPETTTDTQNVTKPTPKQPKTSRQRKNQIINDPAVKTVLMELDATITGIEENQ
jgi:hypothetical protein